MLYFILFVSSCALLFFLLHIQGLLSFRSTCAWCDAGDAFTAWRKENPTTYIEQSETGRKLLQQLVDTYAAFLKNYPFIKDKTHLEFLISLFDECPPDPPKPKKQLPKFQKPFNQEGLFQ